MNYLPKSNASPLKIGFSLLNIILCKKSICEESKIVFYRKIDKKQTIANIFKNIQTERRQPFRALRIVMSEKNHIFLF